MVSAPHHNGRQLQKKATLIRYIQKYPNGWKKRLELADLFCQMGDWLSAISEYRQIVNKQPHLLIVWLKLAKLLVKLDQRNEAITTYEQALSLTEHLATIYHIQGEICSCQGNYQQAIDLFQKASDLEPQEVIHWLVLAKLQTDVDNHEEAISAYRQILSAYPQHPVYLSLVYDQLMLSGEVKEAERILGVLESIKDQNLYNLSYLAYHRFQKGLVTGLAGKETKKLLQRLRKIAPDYPKSYDLEAYYFFLQGKDKEALALWEQLTQQLPDHAYSWYYAAKGLWKLGMYETASQFIQEAYRLSPQDPQLYQALWVILADSSQKNQLLALTDPLFNHFSHRWSMWTTLGQILVEKFEKIDQGCSFASQAIQLQPKLAKAWLAYGDILSLGKRWTEAITVLKQGWHLLPEEKETWLKISASVGLAESYQGLGEDDLSQYWRQIAAQNQEQLIDDYPIMNEYWYRKINQRLAESHGKLSP